MEPTAVMGVTAALPLMGIMTVPPGIVVVVGFARRRPMLLREAPAVVAAAVPAAESG